MEQTAYVNTDKELWREEDDAYAASIHVTEEGKIGINVGGTVHVKDVRRWHQLAEDDMERGLCMGKTSLSLAKPLPPEEDSWRYSQYMQLLIELQKAGHDCHKEINQTLEKLHALMFK